MPNKLPLSKPVLVASVLLLAQGALLFSSIRREVIPQSPPLKEVPLAFGPWTLQQEGVVEKEVQDVLQADDLLNRTYYSSQHGASANLFVAMFRSQRNGKAPHSPKNCLPGGGWLPTVSDRIPIDLGGRSILVNRYIVARGDQKSLVLYWYQSRDRVVADEFRAKFWVMADAIRYNRTDTSLVRVVMNLPQGKSEAELTRMASEFVQSFFAPLSRYLPA
jgi:EpsI family protein